MAKISGSYTSISRGVSQQVPEARLEGQHEEQVNMISDPVNGLTRRHGTQLGGEALFNITAAIPKTGPTRDAMRGFRVFDYNLDGVEYAVLYPTVPVTSDPDYAAHSFLLSLSLRAFRKNKVPGTGPDYPYGGFLNVSYANTNTENILKQGIGAITQVGKYLLLAPNLPTAQAAGTDAWMATTNRRRGVIWVRGGAYARKFKVAVILDGTLYGAEYTTPSASYGGILNTSDIPYGDPDYTKRVNDRVNAYNSAVTAWIGTSGAAVQPPQIAAALATALENNTGNQGLFVARGAHIYAEYNGLFAISVDDGGDGTLLRSVHQTVKSAELVSDQHWAGKIIQVQADTDAPAYYLKAVAVDGQSILGPVRWEECPRITIPTPASPFLIATVYQPTGYLLIADSPQSMRSSFGYASEGLPDIGARKVGDDESSPLPHWWGKKITYMSTFQDRLVIGAGAVITMSETSNYFNFFRASTLTVKDNDPVEVFALGAEDDTIRHSVIFDKSLLLFGDKQQYSIDGRVPVTPATTTVIQSSAVEDATDAAPVAVGDLVFFAKRRENTAQLYQIEIGDVQDTSNSSDVGLQLSDYLPGRPVEILATTSPNVVLVRCEGAPRSVFLFRYIDRGRERVLDSWSRFDYGEGWGEIMGMTLHQDKVLFIVHREAVTVDGTLWTGRNGDWGWICVEAQSLLTSVSNEPYLDSWRPYKWFDEVYDPGRTRAWWNQPWLTTAVRKPSPYWLHGHKPALAGEAALKADLPTLSVDHLVVGLEYPAYVTLTSPYRRDNKDTALTVGRLTVNKLEVAYKDSGGFTAQVVTRYGLVPQYTPFNWVSVETPYGVTTSLKFNGRLLGAADNLVGVQPVSTGMIPCFIGRDSRQYKLTLSANGWQPLTITSIGWTGQWFYNAQRA